MFFLDKEINLKSRKEFRLCDFFSVSLHLLLLT